jgi:hypothetical protein
MGAEQERFETERLVIRRFALDDWGDILGLAVDKESSPYAKLDHAWPTTEEGCRGAASFFAGDEGSWAVCSAHDGGLVGFIRFNGVDADGQLDLGHVFLSTVAEDGYATEAIGRMVDHAFLDLGVASIIGHNPDGWPEQLAPLEGVGMVVRGRGTSFLQRDAEGRPIEFACCTMGITREEWAASRGGEG